VFGWVTQVEGIHTQGFDFGMHRGDVHYSKRESYYIKLTIKDRRNLKPSKKQSREDRNGRGKRYQKTGAGPRRGEVGQGIPGEKSISSLKEKHITVFKRVRGRGRKLIN